MKVHAMQIGNPAKSWIRVLVIAAVVSALLFLPVLIISWWDIGGVLYVLIVVPLLTLVLLIAAVVFGIRRKLHQCLQSIGVAAVFCGVTLFMATHSFQLRTWWRWRFDPGRYKARVLAQPRPANGTLKYTEWDVWGFAGSDNEAYLVFDPEDSLASEMKSHAHGKFRGIGCEVFRMYRLQKQWYVAQCYTNDLWDNLTSETNAGTD